MRIDRDHIIKALETEPLCKGSWITSKKWEECISESDNPLDLKPEQFTGNQLDCPVCAVGATLRSAGVEPIYLEMVAMDVCGYAYTGAFSDTEKELKRGNYLGALSIFFESREWDTREDLINWVKKNIPEDYLLEIKK